MHADPSCTSVEIAEVIRRYLARRPTASDTLDGVARWWVRRQRHEDALEVVERALQLLLQEGSVTVTQQASGVRVYSLSSGPRESTGSE